MAITLIKPTVVAARFRQAFEPMNVWTGLGIDVSGEIATQGDSIDLGKITTEVTVGDYDGSDITFQELSDSKEILNVNKRKWFAISVEDIDEVQARPNVMDEGARKAAVSVNKQTDADHKAEWVADIPTGNSVVGTKVGTKAARTAANGKSLMADINELTLKANKENWPAAGRVLIMVPEAATTINRHILENNPGSGELGDTTFVAGSNRGRLLGWDVRVDTQATYNDTEGTAIMYAVHVSGMYIANQIRKVEPLRLEAKFADAIKGLYVYGLKRADDYIIELKNGA